MSVENIIKDWNNSGPALVNGNQPLSAVVPVVQPQIAEQQSIEHQQPIQQQPATKKTMLELVAEKGGNIESIKPTQQTDLTQKSKAQEIEDLWVNDIGKPETQKYMENLTPEQFKTEFQNRMSTMDIGERTELEKFLFGNTAKEANPVQSFVRGLRGKLSETGVGVKQRVEDLTGSGDEESERENQMMLDQIKQSKKTDYPLTTSAGGLTGDIAQLAPLMLTGVGAGPLLAEGAAYGFTRPQEEGYSGLDVAMSTGGEALVSLVGGKLTEKLVNTLSPVVKSAYSKITGVEPKGKLISESGEPSQELIDALKKQGLTYNDLLDGSGVFKEMKDLLRASPAMVDPEQAVRAARYESLGIKPIKSSVSQGFGDAVNSQVLRRQINDPEAANLRTALADESEGFKESLIDLAGETGSPGINEVGDSIRTAIKSRAADQKEVKNESYKLLAEEAEKVGELLPVASESITEAWNQTKKIKRSQMTGFHSDVKDSLMRFGVIEPDEAFLKMVEKGDEELSSLSIKNFESLRQELNANINPQDPATIAILKPIINKLDESVDIAAKAAESSTAITNLSKEARSNAREFAKEFNSKDMVSDILKTKKGTFDTYQIRGQDIFSKLIKTSRKSPTSQQLTEVITTLEKAGPKGKKAIADLQSATIMDLLNEATSQLSAKGMKGQQFSYTAYRKALEGMGDKELSILFKNNKAGLDKLKELGKAAKDSQTFFDAVPKGSAADIQNMFTRSFAPLFETIGFAKAGTIGKLAAQTMIEKGSERVSKAKLRKAVAEEIKANPKIRTELTKLTNEYPGVFQTLGIALIQQTKEEE